MSAQAEPVPRTPARTGRWLTVVLAAAVAVGATIVLPRILSDTHPQALHGSRSTGTTSHRAAHQLVTGTGPGLVEVAEQSRASRLVTGTGPDLVQLAEQSKQSELAWMYGATVVSGTGPDLAVVGAQSQGSRIYSGQVVTGTGPDLTWIANHRP